MNQLFYNIASDNKVVGGKFYQCAVQKTNVLIAWLQTRHVERNGLV